MRFHISRLLGKVAAGAAITFCFASGARAQTEDQPPKDCFFDCKEQFLLLKSYGDHTSANAIKAAFGEPTGLGKGEKYQIIKYEGSVGEFYILKPAASDKLLGIALFAKDDPAKARIPYLNMGEEDPAAGTYLTYSTLKDITLDFAIQHCSGTVDDIGGPGWVSGQMRVFWTPKCYFGNPGTYMNYSFLFDVPECEPDIPFPMKKEFRNPSEDKGAFTMAQLTGKPYRCSSLGAMVAKAVFVTQEANNPSALAPIIFGFATDNILE